MSFESIQAVVDIHPRILVVDDGLSPSAMESVSGRRVRALLAELKEMNYKILEATSFPDALANLQSDSSIVLAVVDWTLGKNSTNSHQQATGRYHGKNMHFKYMAFSNAFSLCLALFLVSVCRPLGQGA